VIDDIPNQDGVESYRRLMLDLAPAKKAGIDKLLGQTAARATAQGFAKAIVTEGLYAYPSVNGTFANLIDLAEGQADEIRALRSDVEMLRRALEEARLAPFA
jgi:hypothetical protein